MTAAQTMANSLDGSSGKEKIKLTSWVEQKRFQRRRLTAQAQARLSIWYHKVILEFLLRQKPLKPSKDGRRIPLDLSRQTPLIDERRGHAYLSNTIRTARYTVYDFLPKQLFFQFTRLANFYFLCIGIPQMIPGLSTTGTYTTIVPLMFFVLLTIVKEGYDDYKRHRLDKRENANIATVLRRGQGGEEEETRSWSLKTWLKRTPKTVANPESVGSEYNWVQVKWLSIKVGDIINLSRDEAIPADLILLHADGENRMAYVETMALDGETNLKSKHSAPALGPCDSIDALNSTKGEFVLEDPNPDLYRFDGKVTAEGQTLPLTLNEIIYRGSVLRNTGNAIGLVINTGEECKIRMNANQHPRAKKPALESVANKIVITLAFYVIILSVGCSMGYLIWQGSTESISWYLNDAAVQFKQIIIGFAIQFNNVIPLALYVSLEIVRIGQMLWLNWDVEMYDEVSDTPAKCNTNTILENLGQVSYVFSDKTGTLTDNVMKFRKLSIAGTTWLHNMDVASEDAALMSPAEPRTSMFQARRKSKEINRVVTQTSEAAMPSPMSPGPRILRRSSSRWRSRGHPEAAQPEVDTIDLLEYIRLRPASVFARKAHDYIMALALCHTCLPEVMDGSIDFQASSPDELALVRAAQDLGYLVIHRSSNSISVQITDNAGLSRTEVYEILDIIEFSSKRKRMSIIVKYPDGRICLICKGADSMVIPRLKMASLAKQKAQEVRESIELQTELQRRSEQMDPRNSLGGRTSLNLRRSIARKRQASPSPRRPAAERSHSFEASKLRRSVDKLRPSLLVRTASFDASKALSPYSPVSPGPSNQKFGFLDDPAILDDSTVFTRCFQHLDDFASEGLRTLLFARKFIPVQEYSGWKRIYNDATTSLVDRQEMIEAAGEMIEQSMDLVGASAIEDKLQKGVPETIEKLRRANIKIWMLTGDKRETAINIAHSAQLCRPTSVIMVIDATKGSLESQLLSVAEEIQTGSSHTVVVIDGQTLGAVEQLPALINMFYDLISKIDSVICCRASPAQKAQLVVAVRQRIPGALTLSIGDGANDLAMIQASHVGVGISGKEGLQAARVADYAIAQFRFLQRLLLVHGRWNYIRTAKFILATFWKEMFFYLPTALYQRYNGYTGTALYESWSLTVLNVLFTSLAVIVPGMLEQDLSAETLLAVPELYVFGQRNLGLNFVKFIRWMFAAACEGIGVWFAIWAAYGVFGLTSDQGLFAIGNLAFTIGIMWINWKLFILETHHKTGIVLGSFFITIAGWWIWQSFLAGAYSTKAPSPYAVRGGFFHTFGRDLVWWLTSIVVVAVLICVELIYMAVKRNLIVSGVGKWSFWKSIFTRKKPQDVEEWDLELWQELEKDPVIRERLKKLARDEEEEEDEEEPQEDSLEGGYFAGAMVTRNNSQRVEVKRS